MRKERIDGQETREAILKAAEEEFAEKGFELASTREICKKAGANAALVNRYFVSKENLYRLVARRLFGKLEEPMTKVADGKATKIIIPSDMQNLSGIVKAVTEVAKD